MAVFQMAKVMLHMDGSVHICLDDYRTFYATPSNLMAFFSNPIAFIKKGINQEAESTAEINPTRRPLNKMLGVTLVYLTSNKELIFVFPELFQFVFSSVSEAEKAGRLNMKAFIYNKNLSDAKSFLLKFYFDFVQTYSNGTMIQEKVEISKEAFFETTREIFNAVFSIEEPQPPHKNLNDRINDSRHKELFTSVSEDDVEYISVAEYADLHGLISNEVKAMIANGRIKNYLIRNEKYYVDKNETPAPLPRKKKGKTVPKKEQREEPYLASPNNDSWDQLQQDIADGGLFSSVVAKHIYSREELNYYVDAGYVEVLWNNRRCLIKKFDLDYRGQDGRTNRERMRAGRPPLAFYPNDTVKPERPVEVHHLGQQDETFVTIEKHIHDVNCTPFVRQV